MNNPERKSYDFQEIDRRMTSLPFDFLLLLSVAVLAPAHSDP